jgi:anti-sigma-K factor RskA
MINEQPRNSHLDPGQMTRYLERTLTSEERSGIEEHLVACAACKGEIVALTRIRRSGRRHRVAYIAAPLAAAAVAALLIANPFAERPEESLARSQGGEGTRQITALLPADGDTVSLANLTFVWGAVEPDARYRLTLSTDEGAEVWTVTARDTTVSLPDGLTVNPGASYVWYVDALLMDGTSATTGTRKFTVEP